MAGSSGAKTNLTTGLWCDNVNAGRSKHMNKKEELTDVISDKGIREIKVGSVLRFDYEGSLIEIKITKKDTKAMRIWGEHTTLVDMNTGMSHHGHFIDSKQNPPFCEDCKLPINQRATSEGEDIYNAREDSKLSKKHRRELEKVRKLNNLSKRKGGGNVSFR